MMTQNAFEIPVELQDHIDESGFAALHESLKERFASALDDYIEETAELLRELHGALEEEQHAEIARHANLIKSESRSFGLCALAEVAEAIEEMADVAGDSQFSYGDILSLAEQLDENYAAVQPYLTDVKDNYM